MRRAIISPSVTNRSSLKSGISAAIFDGEREASQSVIGRKPWRPAVSASQNSFRPVPIALTGPTPVITAEFFSIFLLCKIIPEIPDQQCAAGSLSVRVQDNMGGTRLVSARISCPPRQVQDEAVSLWKDPEFAAATCAVESSSFNADEVTIRRTCRAQDSLADGPHRLPERQLPDGSSVAFYQVQGSGKLQRVCGPAGRVQASVQAR